MQLEWEPEEESDPRELEEMLAQVHKIGDKRKIKRRSTYLGGTATALVAALLVTYGLTTSSSSHNVAVPKPGSTSVPVTSLPQLTLAARVIQTAQNSLANLHSISATETDVNEPTDFTYWAPFGIGTFTESYRLAADGSFWSKSSFATPADKNNAAYASTTESSYSSQSGVTDSCFYADPNTKEAPSCGNSLKPSILKTDLNAFTEAIAQAEAAQATADESTTDGKKMWTLQFDQHGSSPTSTSSKPQDFVLHTTVTVDQSTGLPVGLATTINGKPLTQSTLTDVQVNPSFATDQLKISYPSNAQVSNKSRTGITFDDHVAMPEAKVLPIAGIPGFTTNEVWTNDHQYIGSGLVDLGMAASVVCQTGDGSTPAKVNFAQQISRAGGLAYWSEAIDLATCPNPPTDTDIVSPSGESGPSPVKAQLVKTFTAVDGAMKGTKFNVYQTAPGKYMLVGRNGKVLAIASGDLSVDQATQVANGYALS